MFGREKTKLLVLGTSQMRSSKLLTEDMKIVVDGKEVIESSSEKLLGLVLNNKLTWKNHLYGDKDNMGLVPQLSRRIGMLKRLSRYMNKDKLKYFSGGIFYSKLNYCLPVFGNIFGLDNYKEENRRYFSFTMKDNNNLQVLQNKLNRLLLDADNNTPTSELLHKTGSLSIHQMIAYQTAITAHKVSKSGKPSYIAAKLKVKESHQNTRQGGTLVTPSYSKNITREGFIYRGANVLNKLNKSLRTETKLEKFKTGLKDWVKANIAIKPKATFPSLTAGYRRNQPPPPPPPPPEPPPRHNTIIQYLVPMSMRPSLSKTKGSTQPTQTDLISSQMKTLHHYFPPANPVHRGGPLHRVQAESAEHEQSR